MNCEECGTYNEPIDTEDKLTFFGTYYQPPECECTWAKYRCKECGHE